MRNHFAIVWLLFQPFSVVLAAASAQETTVGSSNPLEIKVGWYVGSTERGTLTLVYSCLITIFACTWTVLHLNVPGLNDRLWTRFWRKAKWMAITVLFPEFIFSKAICELRLALNDLREFEETLRVDEYNLKWTVVDPRDTVGLTWSWGIEYGAIVKFLYRLMALPQPAALSLEEERPTEMPPTELNSDNGVTGSRHLDDRDSRRGQPASEHPEEPDLSSTKGLPTAEHQATSAADDDFLENGEAIISEQASGISDAREPEMIPTEENGLNEEHEKEEPQEKKPLKEIMAGDEAEGGNGKEKYRFDKDRQGEKNREKDAAEDDGGDNEAKEPDSAEELDSARELDSAGDQISLTSDHVSRNREKSKKRDQPQAPTHTYPMPQHWTLTHSYLANMGGLLYFEPEWNQDSGPKYYAITGAKLSRRYLWIRRHPLRDLVLSEDDINDKSKADWLLKALSILQITWLTLTVLVREVSGLPLTQLEIATFVFSVFAIATYAANWWKPKDVSRPILLRAPGPSSIRVESVLADAYPGVHTFDWTQSFILRLRYPGKTRELTKSIRDITRVPNDMVTMEGNVPLIFSLMAMSALVFGSLHCLAWNFAFPSRAELILWRIASITSAVVPVISLIVSVYVNYKATVHIDNLLVSFLLAKLQPLEKCSPEYLNLLRQPAFESWGWNEAVPIFSNRPGYRHFAQQPTKQEQEELESDGTWDKCLTDRCDMSNFLRNLGEFFDRLKDAKDGKRDAHLVDDLENLYSIMESNYTTAVKEFWDDYESYAKKAVPTGGSEQINYVKCIMDEREPFMNKKERLDAARTNYGLANQFNIFSSGILYVIARLIILILLFTSLRSVPLGVYKNTPWTRFLPSFS